MRSVAVEALKLIATMGDERAIAALSARLSHPDLAVRHITSEALSALAQGISDEHPNVKVMASQALANAGHVADNHRWPKGEGVNGTSVHILAPKMSEAEIALLPQCPDVLALTWKL